MAKLNRPRRVWCLKADDDDFVQIHHPEVATAQAQQWADRCQNELAESLEKYYAEVEKLGPSAVVMNPHVADMVAARPGFE